MQSAIKASLVGTILSFGLSACASLSQPPVPIVNGNPSPPPAVSTVTIQPSNTTTASSSATSNTPISKPEVTAYPVSTSPITITPIKTTTLPPPAANPIPKPAPVAAPRTSVPTLDLPSSRDTPSANYEDERPDTYTVKPGDNLFRIALNHGFGYRELAEMNQISNSDEIKVGQVLRLRDPSEKEATTLSDTKKPSTKETPTTPHVTNENASSPKPTKPVESLPRIASASESGTEAASKTSSNQANGKPEKLEKPIENKVTTKPSTPPENKGSQKTDTKIDNNTEKSDKNNKNAETKTVDAGNTENSSWVWPTQGKLIQSFSEKTKGIDIAGKAGQPIYASGAGKVVYSGSGLRGYGKLIIIKHDKTFLSAYAHNSQLLAKEGQSVTKGQKIAEMGNTDADQTKLHFEIRRYGKPVDPMGYLGKP